MDMDVAETERRSLLATQSKYLALPREIQDMIAEYALICPRAGIVSEHEKWRGTTNILRLCRQTYVESHGILHDQPAHISLIYRGRKWKKPTIFREARHWAETVNRTSPCQDMAYTTHQIRQFTNVIVSIFYFEWEEFPQHKVGGWGYPTLEEEMIDHLEQFRGNFNQLVKVMRTCPYLERLTLQFTRWMGTPTDQIHPDSPIYPTLMGFCGDLARLSQDISVVAESATYSPSHQIAATVGDMQGVSDTNLQPNIGPIVERKELLAHLFNNARQEWLHSQYEQQPARPQRAPPAQIEIADGAPPDLNSNLNSRNGLPSHATTSSKIYRPFLWREKYMAQLETRRMERESKEERAATSGQPRKEAVSKMNDPKYRCKLSYCTYETSSRRAFRRHLFVRRHTFHQGRNLLALSASKNPRKHLRCSVCSETFRDGNEYSEHLRTYRNLPNHWVDRSMYLYDIHYLFRKREWYRTQLFADISSTLITLVITVSGLPNIRFFVHDSNVRSGIDISTIPELGFWFNTHEDPQYKLRNMVEEIEKRQENPESDVIRFMRLFGRAKALVELEHSAKGDKGYLSMAGLFVILLLGVLIVYLSTQ